MGKRDSEKIKRKLDNDGFKESRMITVTDDWYPCYPGNQVVLTITARRHLGHEDAYYARMSVWGADDTGIEMVYEAYTSPVMAYSIYERWKKYIFDRVPDGVDMEWFYEHGFYPG